MITVNFLIYSYKKSDSGKKDKFITATTDSFSLVSKLQDEELEVKKIKLNKLQIVYLQQVAFISAKLMVVMTFDFMETT